MSFLEMTLPMFIFLHGLGIHPRNEGEGRTWFPWKSTVACYLQVIAPSQPSKVTNREKHIPAYINSLSCKVKVFPTQAPDMIDCTGCPQALSAFQ